MKIGIVGGGVFSELCLLFLGEHKRGEEIKSISFFSAAKILPPASLSSTAIISLFGASRASEKNSLIEEGMRWYRAQLQLKGIERSYFKRGKECHEAYLLAPDIFLPSLRTRTKIMASSFKTERKDCLVNYLGEDDLKLGVLGGIGRERFDRIILGSGAYFLNFPLLPLQRSSYRAEGGRYLECEIKLNTPSFVEEVERVNFLYRQCDGKLIISGKKDDLFDSYLLYLSGANEFKSEDLGKLATLTRDDFREFSGLRNTGKKRKFFVGELAPNIYAMLGSGKNGYALAVTAARKVVGEILGE